MLKSKEMAPELGGTCEPAEGARQANRLARKMEWSRLKKVVCILCKGRDKA